MDGNVIFIHQRSPLGLQRSLRRPWPRETLGLGLGLRLPGTGRPESRPSTTSTASHQVRSRAHLGAFDVFISLPCALPAPALQRGSGGSRADPGKGRIRPTGAGSESTPGRRPPRTPTPTCPPRRRSTRPARPAPPRPAGRRECAGAAADASVYVRARRWRRRGKQREQSGERRGSLKRAAMALRSPQVAAGPCPRLEGAPETRRTGSGAGGGRAPAPWPGARRVGVGEGAGTRCLGLGPEPPAVSAPRPPARRRGPPRAGAGRAPAGRKQREEGVGGGAKGLNLPGWTAPAMETGPLSPGEAAWGLRQAPWAAELQALP